MSILFDKEDLEDTKGVIRISKTLWPKEKRQKDKQRSAKTTHKTKDRAIRTPLKKIPAPLVAPVMLL